MEKEPFDLNNPLSSIEKNSFFELEKYSLLMFIAEKLNIRNISAISDVLAEIKHTHPEFGNSLAEYLNENEKFYKLCSDLDSKRNDAILTAELSKKWNELETAKRKAEDAFRILQQEKRK